MTTLTYALLIVLVIRPNFRALGVFSILAFALFFSNGTQAGHRLMDVTVYSLTHAAIFSGIGFLIIGVREFVGRRPNTTKRSVDASQTPGNDAK